MENKKVLHIITISFVINHFFGKQFIYLKDKTGNEYHLGCSPSKELDELSDILEFKKFPVEVTRNISPITDLKAIYYIYKYIKKNKINTIVGHTPKGGMVAMIAGYLAGINERIYFRHGIIYETSSGIKRILLKNIDRLSGNLASKVVCVSESVKDISILDKLNNPKKNIILGLGTCNGIDTESVYDPNQYSLNSRLSLRKELGVENNEVIIGYVGRLVKDKGINELIIAWQILKERHNNIKLLLVGPLEERDAITNETRETILNDTTIIHTGFVLNSSPYFSIMDIFVLPTYREGFPTVSLEASSMEIPVIITKATGCTESIIENQTGMFITNTPDDIAKKIEKYILDKELRRTHGFNGRNFVRRNFEQQRIWNMINDRLGY